MTADGDEAFRLRRLPSVEVLSHHPRLRNLPPERRAAAARKALEDARATLLRGEDAPTDLDALAARAAPPEPTPVVRRAINATGILLHTNLGRATLARAAVQAVAQAAAGHASLETDPETGGRGNRQRACADLLCRLTGAEDALVVNNNAAATLLAAAVLAGGREIVVSRGQLVEIGGHFRLPDVIESAGARLREVGTTNRTRIDDYARAVGPETALLLRVHTSNYRIVGFTEEATLPELVSLGRSRGIPVGDDIGSGALLDLSPLGLGEEPNAPRSVRDGADLVWFSGDKLLGGPQSGILVGRSECIERISKHPLARALRPDKMTLAALEATLTVYDRGDPWAEIPTLRRIGRPAEEVLNACGRVARSLRSQEPTLDVDIQPTESEIGGGSLPGRTLPSWAVSVLPSAESVTALGRRLRRAEAPVYSRIERGRLILDLRAVDSDEEAALCASFSMVADSGLAPL